MMEVELEQRLQASSKEQLVQLLRELVDRHPTLSVEMEGMLESFAEKSELPEESDEEIKGRHRAQEHGGTQREARGCCSRPGNSKSRLSLSSVSCVE